MIRIDYQTEVDCAGCGQKAHHREVEIRTDHNVRRVSYLSHAECLTDDAHLARAREVDYFLAALDKLAHESNQGLPELPKGMIQHIDLGYVLPSACEAYEKATPIVTIRGFGQTDELVLDPIIVKSTTAADLQNLAVDAANKGMESLRMKFEAGRF